MQIHSIGIDLGKTTFHLVALGAGQGQEEVYSEAVSLTPPTCRLRFGLTLLGRSLQAGQG